MAVHFDEVIKRRLAICCTEAEKIRLRMCLPHRVRINYEKKEDDDKTQTKSSYIGHLEEQVVTILERMFVGRDMFLKASEIIDNSPVKGGPILYVDPDGFSYQLVKITLCDRLMMIEDERDFRIAAIVSLVHEFFHTVLDPVISYAEELRGSGEEYEDEQS